MREILLVEDSDVDAEQAEAALKAIGVTNPVCHLSDGAAAMRYLAALVDDPNAVPPSVILLDVKLPWATGFEILQWMRDKTIFRKVLKIVLSSLDDTATIKDAYHLGANSFISKPITHYELRELITAYPQYWTLSGGSAQLAS
jgi:CheY-like chemotaxis protein